jgi:hypothetical protein
MMLVPLTLDVRRLLHTLDWMMNLRVHKNLIIVDGYCSVGDTTVIIFAHVPNVTQVLVERLG